MNNIQFKPTVKQHELFLTFGNENILEILFGGAAGGGKSYALWSLIILKAIEYPLIRIGLARQTLTQIKKNTMSTFYEVTRNLSIDESLYTYNENKGEIKFYNGSIIQFFELRYLPSDPDYDRFGGALLTIGCIEEAAGCDTKGKQIFSSRLGRWMNDEYNIPPHLYMTTNPGTNFVYSEFYIPWTKNELPQHRYYIPAKLTDNNYQSKYYADALLNRLDKANADRLLKGDWNFDHDTSRLMTYNAVNSIFHYKKDFNPLGEMYLTADIAFTGDRCIMVIWKGLTILEIINYTGKEPEIEIERLALLHKINPDNIAYDSDGVGKYLKTKLPRAYDVINNSKPINNEKYDMLKSQLQFKLAQLISDGLIKCMDDKFRDDTIQELYEIKSKNIDSTEGKLGVRPKSETKKIIGRSPDIADAISFRMVFELKKKVSRPFSLGR